MRKEYIGLMTSKETKSNLRAIAEEKKWSMTTLVNEIIEAYIKENKGSK